VIPVGNVPELTEYVYAGNPPITLPNGLKLVIAVLKKAKTVFVAPVVAVIGTRAKVPGLVNVCTKPPGAPGGVVTLPPENN
jgi:hypothetical protein